ncbi:MULTISPECIES: hypothetical protein [unclassified Nocardia]|nr:MULTISPECIES: hypothetical protein [unclassified Nocardia]
MDRVAPGEGAWLRAGAGVVGQSRPEREFEQTCEDWAASPYAIREQQH